MSADDPYAILFEPVKIGSVTAKNRFYQVPHCCGMGHLRPQSHAAMREVKAEGGWAVVSTEEAEIHPSTDLSPAAEQRIWDERDVSALRLMTEAVHRHDALAAIELVHNGHHAPNLTTRIPPMAPSPVTIDMLYPKQARAMDKQDIRDLRNWHKRAVRLSKQAGFDIIYAYAGHHMTIAHHFLSRKFNHRIDEYGGSLENRLRLTRELIEDSLEEANGECAIAFRFAVDDLEGQDGMQADEEGRAVVEALANLPDLWDVNVAGWENDSVTARFEPGEGFQEAYTSFVKSLTDKPVVGVGRYTSPDRMASLVRRGVLDFIGAARPSIADPYLPAKIKNGCAEDICECIGCNICVSSDNHCVPIRCTQNPTMGEEWRRGWHPERANPNTSDEPVLIIGGGPAGLECARHLSDRGHAVTLAEARSELGGRVLLESRLKGLSSWLRVRDYRQHALEKRADVQLYCESELTAEDVLGMEFRYIFVATGADWRLDGLGRTSRRPIEGLNTITVLSPEDVMCGMAPVDGPVLIYDDDQGYLGGALADHIADLPNDILFVTPASVVSPWAEYTLEQERIHAALLSHGVTVHLNTKIVRTTEGAAVAECVFSGMQREIACATLIPVTERISRSELAERIKQAASERGAKIHVEVIGDAYAPGLIADAVFAGHLAARNFQRDPEEIDRELFVREMPTLVWE